jgi:CheY-like chemotaxis protein
VSIAAESGHAFTAMETHQIAAVVIHISEPREKAFAVFAGIFEYVNDKSIPIIFLAEKGNDDDETAAFELGAVDYSARRHGTTEALIKRINLRICEGELQRRHPGAKDIPYTCDVSPEEILAGKTILIADDLAINREIIAGMLAGVEGLSLEFAESGEEAVEKFSRAPELYSLILMDVQMPVMDGLAATKIIRGMDCKNARDIPIIAATASIREDEISTCLEAGMNDYIEKPMPYDKLLAIIAEHCV